MYELCLIEMWQRGQPVGSNTDTNPSFLVRALARPLTAGDQKAAGNVRGPAIPDNRNCGVLALHRARLLGSPEFGRTVKRSLSPLPPVRQVTATTFQKAKLRGLRGSPKAERKYTKWGAAHFASAKNHFVTNHQRLFVVQSRVHRAPIHHRAFRPRTDRATNTAAAGGSELKLLRRWEANGQLILRLAGKGKKSDTREAS